MSATALETGIYNLFSATNDFKTDMGGRLYAYEAPDDPTYPYCVYYPIGDKPMYWFGDSNPEEGEDYLMQFGIFYKDNKNQSSPININSYELHLKALFDWASITVSGYTLMEMRRQSSVTIKIDDVWYCATTYRIKIDKN